jgi:2-methylcitrate dehydratase PrpD
MTILNTLANWVVSRNKDWSETALLRAEHAINDTLACIIAGSTDQVSKKVADGVGRWSTNGVSIIGTTQTAAAPWAAMINGTAAHVLEIDDNFYPALTHASAILVPALFAVAEEINASGADVIDAYNIGLELHALLGRGVNRSHYFTGWHPTATVGCIGTAAACARMLGLGHKETVATMSIAVSMASGNKAQFGTEAKSFQCGMGASNAVTAAYLGAAGVTGNPEVLEDPQGFLALYGGPSPRGWEDALTKLDNPLAIEAFGLAPKRHACCGSAHNTLDCILDLIREHGFGACDVAAIDVLVGASNKKNLRYDDPQDGFQARFSMHYNIALILLYGRCTLADFTSDAVQRPEVRALMNLTTLRARSFDDEPKDPDERPPHIVSIELKDGRKLQAQRVFAHGLPQYPFTNQERAEKIEQCVLPVLERQAYLALLPQLLSLRKAASIRHLAELWSRPINAS